MKKYAFLPALFLLLAVVLTGCARSMDGSGPPAWQGTLPATGAEVTLRGAAVTQTAMPLWSAPQQPLSDAALTLLADARPTVEIAGVPADAVSLAFATPQGAGRISNPDANPVEKLDYRRQTPEEADTLLALDTVYDYLLTVQTDKGTDYLIICCQNP